jgi:hypothetical protein
VSHAKSSLRCKPFLYLIHTLPRLLIVSAWILRSACTSGIQHRSQFISSISLHVRLGGCYNPLVVTPPPVQVNRGEARFEQARCCADQAHLSPWRNTDRSIPYGVPQRRKRASPLQYVDPFRLFILYSHRKLPCQVHDMTPASYSTGHIQLPPSNLRICLPFLRIHTFATSDFRPSRPRGPLKYHTALNHRGIRPPGTPWEEEGEETHTKSKAVRKLQTKPSSLR